MAERQNKVKKYRKPLNLNIGMLIFGAIFIYVIICVIMYFQTDHIVRYEVTEGSITFNGKDLLHFHPKTVPTRVYSCHSKLLLKFQVCR